MKDTFVNNYTNIELIKDIWGYIKPYKKKFFLGTLLRITSDIIWLYPIWALAEIITFASNYQLGQPTTYAWTLMGSIVACGIYHFICHDYCKYFIYQVSEHAHVDAMNKSLQHLFRIDMQWHEKENSGNKMQKIVKGGESLKEIIRMFVDLVIESTVNLIAIFIVLAYLNTYFILLLSVFFVSYYILSLKLTNRAKYQSHIVNVEWEKYNGISFEAINNISIVKSLRIGNKILPFIHGFAKTVIKKTHRRIVLYRTRSAVLNLYSEAFRIVSVSYTLYLIFDGQLEVGVLALVLLYFGKIERSAFEFSETYHKFIMAKIAMIRMNEILETQPVIENVGTQTFTPNWKTLEFKNVSFKYHGKNVLKNFSLTIKKGEKVGIVGISGTGKSTLFKLILKLYNNYEGSITFDGVSLNEITRESFMKSVAVVPQETELFNLSLEQNITLTQNSKNEDQLTKALEIAHVKEFLHKLPEGIESLVGEKGIKLSGGEKQRVGIARAIYKHPEILLLDEATSHLDVQSEKNIQDALHTFFEDITAIVIAHRLTTIKEMDKIVVMDKGEVLEYGSFDELMNLKGEFYKLWEKQKF